MNEFMKSPGSKNSEQSAADVRLDSLFQSYRVACEPGDINPNFMPDLWQKIEAVQSSAFSFRRIARAFVTVAAALTLVLAGIEAIPHSHSSPVFSATYVEAVADHSDTDASYDISRPESSIDLAEATEVI